MANIWNKIMEVFKTYFIYIKNNPDHIPLLLVILAIICVPISICVYEKLKNKDGDLEPLDFNKPAKALFYIDLNYPQPSRCIPWEFHPFLFEFRDHDTLMEKIYYEKQNELTQKTKYDLLLSEKFEKTQKLKLEKQQKEEFDKQKLQKELLERKHIELFEKIQKEALERAKKREIMVAKREEIQKERRKRIEKSRKDLLVKIRQQGLGRTQELIMIKKVKPKQQDKEELEVIVKKIEKNLEIENKPINKNEGKLAIINKEDNIENGNTPLIETEVKQLKFLALSIVLKHPVKLEIN